MMKADVRALELYCDSDRQREVVALAQTSPNLKAAADTLGITLRNVNSMLARLRVKRDAAESGAHPPDQRFLLPGQKLKGLSTMVKTDDGLPQWIKTGEDQAYAEQLLEELRDDFTRSIGKAEPVDPPAPYAKTDLCNMLVVTDYHLGMKAWGEETSHNWDMKIAEDLLVAWVADAIRRSPPADQVVFAQLGDFLHYDSLEALTPTSGHIVDADSRAQLMVRISLRVLRRVTQMLLDRFPAVHIIQAEGNHDIYGSGFLREVWSQFYSDEPRLSVEISPDPYYAFEWGSTSLFFHHGHKKRMPEFDRTLAAKFRRIWGRTDYSYGHMGHLHHDKLIETNLMHVEQHETLAAPDSYASRGGWLSQRSAKVITYHKKYGEVSRNRITPKMIGHE